MPFLAPVIAGIIGVGLVGQALIGVGLSLAMSLAARALGPKPRPYEESGRGMRLNLRLDPNAPREFVIGTAAVAGTLVYHNVFGPNGNDNLDLVYAIADHECDSLNAVYVNGVAVTRDGSTGAISQYSGMVIKFYGGAASQTASSELVADSGGRWTSNYRGRGVCYVHVRMSFNQDLYPSGVPRFLFIVKGAKLYDWRKDDTAGGSGSHRWGSPSTYEWSDNPVVALYNYRRGIWAGSELVMGMATPASALPVSDWTAAANACDESVGLKAGGTEKRYRINGVLSSQTHRDNITDILTAMAGREIASGGIIRPLAGVAQSSVMTFTDADIITDSEVTIRAKRPRSELINAVFGSYHDPAQIYESVASPARISPTDEATDGGIRLAEHFALDLVTSQSQAQRILEILRRRARQQGEVRVKLRPRFAVLEAGDWVTWNSDRYGYTSATFEVTATSVGPDWTVTLTLREIASSVYSWTAASDELDPADPNTVSPGSSTIDRVSGLAVEPVTISGSSRSTHPGLHATWTSITDNSVVELRIEYRVQGSTTAQEHRVLSPSAGQSTWITGILSGVIYEIRALPVVRPERTVVWSSWVATGSVTADEEVPIGTPGDGKVTKDKLDPQSKFELSLTTGIEELQGSAADRVRDAQELARKAAGNALRGILDAHDAKALVRTETVTRETESGALASQVTTIATTVNGHSATLTELGQSVDGLSAQWGVAININGQVVGLVQLDGSANGSQFSVLADKFVVAKPDGTGSQVIFTVGTNANGASAVGINGSLLIDGSITARSLNVATLSAIVANIGEVTAGKMRSSDSKMIIDLDAKSITMDV